MKEDVEVTVCIRKETPNPIVEGSTIEKCIKCKHDVWVSPATKLSIEQGIYSKTIVCVNCCCDLVKNGIDKRGRPPNIKVAR